jgi:hypothetical protein
MWSGALTDMGFQVVTLRGAPVWGCAYRGGIVDPGYALRNDLENEVFAFLGQALRAGHDPRLPIRGPARFLDPEGFHYSFEPRGTLGGFEAGEAIYFQGRLLYARSLVGGAFGDKTLFTGPVTAKP